MIGRDLVLLRVRLDFTSCGMHRLSRVITSSDQEHEAVLQIEGSNLADGAPISSHGQG